MFFQHSIKNAVRSWKKTLLFIFLLTLLVIIMCTGVSISISVRDFITECEESYTTIARLEYMGVLYPDETEYDPGIARCFDAFDFTKISAYPVVKQWDASAVALGYIEERTGRNPNAHYKNSAVLIVRADGFMETEGVNRGFITKSLYASEDIEGDMLYIDAMGEKLQRGRYYLMHGTFYYGITSYRYFRLSAFNNAGARQNGIDGSVENMIVDITEPDGGYKLPQDSDFYGIADTYTVVNNSVTVNATDNLEALFPFHQGTLYLTEGRFFSPQEYEAGDKVCIVPGSLAQSLNAGVGDTVRLSVAVQSGCAKYESYWAPSGFNHTDEYTIVGICNTQNELSGDIFIPKTGAIDFSPNHFSFTLGQVVLDNDTAYRFIADIEPSLPDRARVTVFDQGYTAVVRPMKDVMRVALIVTGICAAAGLAIAALFGFVFVYRQKDSAKIMRMLGAKKREIIGYYLYGSGCLSFFGSAIGIVIGILISEICMGLVRQFAFHYGADSFLYSSGSQSMIKAAEYQPGINVWVFAGTGFAVFLLAVLSCRIFAGMCLRSHNRKRRKYAFLKRARSSSLTGGPLKFSWLSVKRGCLRSFVPAAVCLCAVVLLNQLVYTAEGNKKKLSDLSRNTSTMGYLTDSKGHKIDGLNIGGAALNGLYSSDQLSDIHTSKRICYYYLSKASEMDEALDSLLPKIYATSFSFETFMNKLNSGPGLIYTNDFSSVPEFYYSTKITTNYLDGYDESLFTRDAGDTASCLVSESFMREQGIKAGDTIAVLILREEALGRQSVDTQELFVAGSYIKAGKDDNIYCQLDAYVSEFQLSDPGADADTLRQYTFSSASFTLKNSEGLSAFKAYLFEKGYSEVNTLRSIRSFVVLEDIAYIRTKSAMNRRIWYMDHAFPVIYVAILLFAGLIPFIFILLRKREIAIMRSMGASKTTACLSMFFEQVMLCIPGSMIGYIVLRIIHRVFNLFGFLLTCAFILCWLFGALLSIKNINRFAVQEILRVEE